MLRMLYRPNYCSNCGERIERAVWHIWTSRRFCDVCVTEHPFAEYGPRATILAAIIAILAGATAYFVPTKTEDTAKSVITRSDRPLMTASLVSTPMPTPKVEASAPTAPTVQAAKPAVVVEQDIVNFCGAETKKGTPCSRRVKGNNRCFQHQGMPAMTTIASQGR